MKTFQILIETSTTPHTLYLKADTYERDGSAFVVFKKENVEVAKFNASKVIAVIDYLATKRE